MQNPWSYSGPTELNSTFKNMPKRFLDTLKAEKQGLDTFDFVVVLLPILLSVFPPSLFWECRVTLNSVLPTMSPT